MPEFVIHPAIILALKIGVLLALLPLTLVLGWFELKIMAHMQHRLGPMFAGSFHGWAQTLADGLKFVTKEDIIPRAADKWVFSLAPYITMLAATMIFVVIPIDGSLVIEELDVGLFFLLAISSIGVIGVLMAGLSSSNKYSLIGALRSAAQLISYELPLVFAAAAVAMQAGTMSLNGIAEAQKIPFAIWAQPLGFFVFTVASVAELTRTPFDMPVADSEIITGPFTEYTGIRFAFGMFAAEYLAMIALSAVAATLFLGGYMPALPFLDVLHVPGPLWLMAKTALVLFLLIWIRVTFPRLREDQLQKFAWKFLVPLSLVNIAVTGALKLTSWM